MAEPITRDTIMAGRLRENGHLNYGKRGGGTVYQHTTIPRLSAIDRPTLDEAETKRLGVSRLREWSVDGGRAGSLEDAIAALNVPAVLTVDQAAVLAFVPDDWTPLITVRKQVGEQLGRKVGIEIMLLRQKGAIENEMRAGDDRRSDPWIRKAPGVELKVVEGEAVDG